MKRVAIVLLFLSALFVASAAQSLAAPAGQGSIRIKHSPTVGLNMTFAVWIDGVKAGSFSKGHVFDRALTPGRHEVIVRESGRRSPWHGTLDVKPGQTYSFVVKITPDQVHLDAVGRVD